MRKGLRVYVAGAYNAGDVVSVLDNMRRGMRLAAEVLLAGHYPFTPWHDYHHQLMLGEGERLSVEDYRRFSMAWLEVSDCVLVQPVGVEDSAGTMAELNRAMWIGIPVYWSLDCLIRDATTLTPNLQP